MPGIEPKYPKKEDAKELFMASPHFTWRSFALAQGWNAHSTRRKYPVVDWIQEKIGVQAKEFGSELEGMMAEQTELWYNDVSKTIREYPAMLDSVSQVVKFRTNQYLKVIQEDLKNGTNKFKEIPSSEIRHLTQAAKLITEAKYGSLMLNEMQLKEFEKTADGAGKIVFEIAGGGDSKNIRKIMEEWHNK